VTTVSGWLIVGIGFLIGVIPTMVLQVWNGASLIGLLLAVWGSTIVLKGVTEDV